MSVLDLKYKNKYLKYKNKYLNLQRQIGGVDDLNPPIPPQHSLPNELVSSILMFSKSPPVNKETRQLMKVYKDTEIETSLKRKLRKTTLDGLFSTGNRIDIIEQLNYEEIYLLAKLFVSDIVNTTSLEFYYDIVITPPEQPRYNIVYLAPLKNALLNPTRPLFLTTDYGIKEEGYITFGITGLNDPIANILIDFQLRFIFFCIDIMKRQGDIAIDMNDDFYAIEYYTIENPFTNSFNTIILGLKMNIPIKILKYTDATLSDNFASIKALAEVLKTNTTLTKLNLSKNSIGNQGASAFAEALKTNTTLTTLDFSWNYIDIKGAKKLVEAMKINSTLTTLYLKGNYEIPNTRSYLRDNGVVRNIKTD
jgi:hypothetical protein